MRNSFVPFHLLAPPLARRGALAVVLTAALIASACGRTESTAAASTPPEARPVDVAAIQVQTTDIEQTLQISGNVMPQARVSVMATLPGTLERVLVNLGDRVRTGQVVGTLDRREIDAQVDAAEAAVAVARAGLEAADAALANAVLEHDRSKNLFDRGALPRQRLDTAETARRAAAAQRDLAAASLTQAEAAQRRAREIQRDATLTSPIDGVIVERNYDPGSLVGPGERPVVVVADLRVIKLEAGVSELEAGRLRVGLPARVTAQALPGRTFDGRLAAIVPEVDARNRHFRIEVRIPNTDGALLSGMYGVAVIPLQRAAQVTAIPRDAVATRGSRRVALKFDNGALQEVAVTEGLTDGRLVQVTGDLKAGDTIVADARQDVAPGTRVNPVLAK